MPDYDYDSSDPYAGYVAPADTPDVAGLEGLDDQAYTSNGDSFLPSGGSVSTAPTDYQTKSDGSILDKLGNVIGKLASGQTLKDFVAAYAVAHNNTQATALQENLRQSAVGNLQALANQLRDSSANPQLLQYVETTMKAVSQGTIQPAQALASVQGQTKLAGIQVPAQFTDAINSTLSRLDTVAKNGYTPIERAAIQKALDQIGTQERGELGAIRNQAQEQGQYGTGAQLVSGQMAQQAAANTAAQTGLDIQSQGLKRALDALTSEGNLAVTADNQSFGQQKDVASAGDAIAANNAALAQQAQEQNAARAQAAQTANITNAQHVQDTNVAQSDLETANQLKAAQQVFDNAQKQKEDAATVDVNAAKNAGTMWGKTYDQQLATTKAANDQLKTAIAPAATTNSSGSSDTDWGKLIGSGLGAYFSDEKVKDNKQEMSDDDIEGIFNQLVPTSYTYKKQTQALGAPSGNVVGVMAQDLEKSPQGATLVIDTPDGKKVDPQKALQLALAAIASMNGRVNTLEGK